MDEPCEEWNSVALKILREARAIIALMMARHNLYDFRWAAEGVEYRSAHLRMAARVAFSYPMHGGPVPRGDIECSQAHVMQEGTHRDQSLLGVDQVEVFGHEACIVPRPHAVTLQTVTPCLQEVQEKRSRR